MYSCRKIDRPVNEYMRHGHFANDETRSWQYAGQVVYRSDIIAFHTCCIEKLLLICPKPNTAECLNAAELKTIYLLQVYRRNNNTF